MATDTLGRAAGSGCVARLAGRDFVLTPLNLQDWGTLRNECSMSYDAFEAIRANVANLPPELAKHAWDKAVEEDKERRRRGASDEEVGKWLLSGGGFAVAFWLSLKRENKSCETREQVEQLMSDATADEVAAALDKLLEVSGIERDYENPTQPTRPQQNGSPSSASTGADSSE